MNEDNELAITVDIVALHQSSVGNRQTNEPQDTGIFISAIKGRRRSETEIGIHHNMHVVDAVREYEDGFINNEMVFCFVVGLTAEEPISEDLAKDIIEGGATFRMVWPAIKNHIEYHIQILAQETSINLTQYQNANALQKLYEKAVNENNVTFDDEPIT